MLVSDKLQHGKWKWRTSLKTRNHIERATVELPPGSKVALWRAFSVLNVGA